MKCGFTFGAALDEGDADDIGFTWWFGELHRDECPKRRIDPDYKVVRIDRET